MFEYLIFQINLVAPPLYVMTTQTLDRQEGLARLEDAVALIKDTIEKVGGKFTLEMAVSFIIIFSLHQHFSPFQICSHSKNVLVNP